MNEGTVPSRKHDAPITRRGTYVQARCLTIDQARIPKPGSEDLAGDRFPATRRERQAYQRWHLYWAGVFSIWEFAYLELGLAQPLARARARLGIRRLPQAVATCAGGNVGAPQGLVKLSIKGPGRACANQSQEESG